MVGIGEQDRSAEVFKSIELMLMAEVEAVEHAQCQRYGRIKWRCLIDRVGDLHEKGVADWLTR